MGTSRWLGPIVGPELKKKQCVVALVASVLLVTQKIAKTVGHFTGYTSNRPSVTCTVSAAPRSSHRARGMLD